MTDLLLAIIVSPIVLAFFLQSMDILPDWGKKPSDKKEVVFGREQCVMVWKNWKEWVWLEVLLSPIFIWAYIGVGMFYVLGFILIGLTMNPVSVWLGKKIGAVLISEVGGRKTP